MLIEFKRKLRLSVGYWNLLVFVVWHLKLLRLAPIEKEFHRQLHYSGLDAIYVITAIALLCGTLVITQTTYLVGGNSELTVKMLIWIVVREVGPLLCAMFIIARSSVSVASELALMRVNQELVHLERMGISPLNYLIVPRAAGIALAVFALTIYFQIIAVGGGLAMSALFQNTSLQEQTDRFLQIISVMDLLLVAVKAVLFGAAIAIISCYHGIYALPTHTGVSKAAVRAVSRSLLVVFVLDVGLSYLISLL
ncbi:MAG: ABC transporter permease [Gallionella sp.]|nr:ABC transporter permease [Gallionella sp.]